MDKSKGIVKQNSIKKEYKPLTIYNERMLTVLDFVVKNNINGISADLEFLHTIDFPHKNNIYIIRRGMQSFSLAHMLAVHLVYNVDMNYIFNKEHLEMFIQKNNHVSTYHRLLEVVHMVGLEINK